MGRLRQFAVYRCKLQPMTFTKRLREGVRSGEICAKRPKRKLRREATMGTVDRLVQRSSNRAIGNESRDGFDFRGEGAILEHFGGLGAHGLVGFAS